MVKIWEGPAGWFYEVDLRFGRHRNNDPLPDVHKAFDQVAMIMDRIRRAEHDEAN